MLAKSAVEEFHARDRRDLRWIKDVSRDELWDSIRALTRRPFHFKTDPWEHQLACFYIGACFKRWLFTIDMGGGKTKLTCDLASYFKQRGAFETGLVFIPRRVLLPDWLTGIDTHSDLTATAVEATKINEKWECLMDATTDLVVIDYKGFELATTKAKAGKGERERDAKKGKQASQKFKFVAADEFHRTGKHTTLMFRLVHQLSKSAECFFGMTGTPLGRNPERLWSQMLLIDQGYSLGETLALFREVFYKKSEKKNFWSGTEDWVFDRSKSATLHRYMQNRSIRYRENEFSDLPPVMPSQVEVLLTAEQEAAYELATRGEIRDGARIPVEAAFYRTRQIAAGYVDWKDSDGQGRHVVYFKENPKLEALIEYIENMPEDKRFLVFHDYTLTGQLICDALTKAKVKHLWIYGGTKKPGEVKQRFTADRSYRGLVLNNASGSEGLELQTANYVLLFEGSPSPITRSQSIKRANRHGVQGRVHVVDFVARGTVDVRILDFIKQGKDLQRAVVDGRNGLGLLNS